VGIQCIHVSNQDLISLWLWPKLLDCRSLRLYVWHGFYVRYPYYLYCGACVT